MTNKAESLLSADGFWQSQPGVWTRAFGNPPMVVDFMREGLRPGWASVAIPADGLNLVVHAEQQQTEAAALRQTLQGILNRFEREDTGKGFPERGGQIAWAMASDARSVLASAAAGQPLLDRLLALEEALKPFAAFYEAWVATKYPEHMEADIDTSAIATQRFTEAGDFVNTRITYADLHRARAVLQQALRSSPMNGEQKGGDQG